MSRRSETSCRKKDSFDLHNGASSMTRSDSAHCLNAKKCFHEKCHFINGVVLSPALFGMPFLDVERMRINGIKQPELVQNSRSLGFIRMRRVVLGMS